MIKDRIDLQIVQAAENTFFCDTENASQEAVFQMLIILEGTRKQIADEQNNIVIEAAGMTLLNGLPRAD